MAEKSRILNEKEAKEVLELLPSQIDENIFVGYFANRASRKARFKTYDIIEVPPGKVYNKTAIRTTVGRYVWNLFLLDYDLLEMIGYQNYTMKIDKVQGKVDTLLMEDKITGQRYAEFLNKIDFSYSMARYLTPSLTLNILKPSPKANALKKQLIEENKEKLEKGDFVTMGNIEKQVLAVAEKEIKDLPDYEIYESGAGGGKGKAFNNAYKNMSFFRGAIRSLADNDYYYISTNSLIDGIPPEEQDKYADITVQASYGRAIG